MSGLDSRYISSIDLEPYFVSDQNGEANAYGVVTFYKDDQRTSQKLVYQLTYNSGTGAYSYVPLPNPITLSGVGTFQNAAGDNIAVYYYPYDEFGNEELYYITVDDQYGNRQFTREAWPYPHINGSSAASNAIGLTNQLSNPQFALVNFGPNAPTGTGNTLSYTISGAGTTTIPIAPDWDLTIVATGASTLTVTQTPVTGQSKLPYNPPFTLDVAYGANITSCKIIQTLNNNPDWAAPQTTGVMGYLAASILIGDGTSVTMQYVPSAGNPAQTILNAANNTGAYVQETSTVQLQAANNTDTGATGYDQIVINLISATSSISNVQVIPMTSNVSGVQYDQTPVNRQIDHLFNYYNPLIQFMPNPNYLPAWDFALNPAQFLGYTVGAFATGANSSNYIWDDVILFQSANSGITTSQGISGALRLTAAADTKCAIIKYFTAVEANDLAYSDLCVMIEAITTQNAGLPVTVSLWYTTNANLPSTITSQTSVVTALDNNGHPSAVAAGWTEWTRDVLQNATYTLTNTGSSGSNFYFSPFNGWKPLNPNPAFTFMAIVVGTGVLTTGLSVSFQSVSLQKGNIPTVGGANTKAQVLQYSQTYYEKSFNLATVPAQNVGQNSGEFTFSQIVGAGTPQISGTISYKATKAIVPNLITTYSPGDASAEVYNFVRGLPCSAILVANNNQDGFYISFTSCAGSALADTLGIHWASDARLGY